LIKKHEGRYLLTSLGEVVYQVHVELGKALNYYWKVRVIESVHYHFYRAFEGRAIKID
jgi:hypothetical protein